MYYNDTNSHGALSFGYDSEGLRLWKTVGTGQNAVEHYYTWQGDKLIAESYGDTELEFFYDESGRPYALLVRDNGASPATESWYYYVTNLQGDVVLLLDASGNTAAEYRYNAWGQVLTATGTMAAVNPLRYRGYYYDAETKLYYLQSRYYDPQLCRFLNADSLASTGQGILGCNMFAYCGNDPVNGADPRGEKMWYQDADGNDYETEPRHVIRYIVPLFKQKETKLCWAFCFVMHDAYKDGLRISQDEAFLRARRYGELYHPLLGWNTGLPFFLQGKKAQINSITELYNLLKSDGPVYAAYNIPWTFDGHIVLVTGVDIDNGLVYTNNPWGVRGRQLYSDFLNDFAFGPYMPREEFRLYNIYIPTF